MFVAYYYCLYAFWYLRYHVSMRKKHFPFRIIFSCSEPSFLCYRVKYSVMIPSYENQFSLLKEQVDYLQAVPPFAFADCSELMLEVSEKYYLLHFDGTKHSFQPVVCPLELEQRHKHPFFSKLFLIAEMYVSDYK